MLCNLFFILYPDMEENTLIKTTNEQPHPNDMDDTSTHFDEHFKQLSAASELAELYVFTDIQLAHKHLGELQMLLKKSNNPDFELSFHLNTALVENQLYNYKLSEIHFQNAIEILKERGDATQLAEAYIDYAGTLLNLEQIEKVEQLLDQASKFLKTFPEQRLEARLICRFGFLFLLIRIKWVGK